MICRIFCFICLASAVSSPATLLADCRDARQLYEKALATPDTGRAIEYVGKSLEKCPDFDAYYFLGKTWMKAGNIAKAEPAFRNALNIAGNPGARARALAGLGQAYLASGKTHNAVLCFKSAYKAHPYPLVLKKLVEIEKRQAKEGLTAGYIRRSLCANSKAMFGVEPSVDIRINFQFDSAKLNDRGKAQAARLGEALNHPDLAGKTIILVGHTDIRGTDEYNLELSRKRAGAVKRFLQAGAGVPGYRILIRGMGESAPLYPGDTEQIHALNRRVEVMLETSR